MNTAHTMLFVSSDDNVGALFYLAGAANTVTKLLGDAIYTSTKDNAGSINIYYDGGYKLQNRRGGPREIAIFKINL